MQARMKNPGVVIPDAMTAIRSLNEAIKQGGVPPGTLDLVRPGARRDMERSSPPLRRASPSRTGSLDRRGEGARRRDQRVLPSHVAELMKYLVRYHSPSFEAVQALRPCMDRLIGVHVLDIALGHLP